MQNKTTQQVTKEAQTKVSDALTVFYDAQLALQKDAFDTARATFEGALALQRASLRAFARGFDVATVPVPTEEQVAAQFRAYVSTLPGMTPETVAKMTKDVSATFVTVRDTTGKQLVAMREAATQAASQYEAFLAQVEKQAQEGFGAASESFAGATRMASQVTGEYVDAMFDAVAAAVKAAEDAQGQWQGAAEKTVAAAKTN